MTDTTLLERVMMLIPVLLSLTVHEWAHAFSAYRLGDDTAARMGRLTLNPVAHIDPIGTLLLPLLGIPFGWARPVPVNPARFNRNVTLRTGMVITAAAGPLSNLVLALLCIVAFGVVARVAPESAELAFLLLVRYGFTVNVALAVFNMLPIPPLDGSRVADGLMPNGLRPTWERFAAVGPVALLAVIFMPQLFHFSVLDWPLRKAWQLADPLLELIITL